MRTLEMVNYLAELGQRLGYEVREEWLDGKGGGLCEWKGRKILFVDRSLPPADRLADLVRSLRGRADWRELALDPDARALLEVTL